MTSVLEELFFPFPSKSQHPLINARGGGSVALTVFRRFVVHATCYTTDNEISGSGSLTTSPSSFFVLSWHWCVLSQAWAMMGSSLPLVLRLCKHSLYCHVAVAREPFCWSIKGEAYSSSLYCRVFA